MWPLITALEEAPKQPSAGQALLSLLFPIILCFIIFWFMLIRPQKKEQQKRQQMLNALAKDDHVWISPGIYGIVEKIKGDYVLVKIDEKNEVKIRVLKSAILQIVDKQKQAVLEEKT